jgi:hypothetical protein
MDSNVMQATDDESKQTFAEIAAAQKLACPACRYELQGVWSARCPECGRQLRLLADDGVTIRAMRWWMPPCLVLCLILSAFSGLQLINILNHDRQMDHAVSTLMAEMHEVTMHFNAARIEALGGQKYDPGKVGQTSPQPVIAKPIWSFICTTDFIAATALAIAIVVSLVGTIGTTFFANFGSRKHTMILVYIALSSLCIGMLLIVAR